MRRRRFMEVLGAVSLAGSVAASTGSAGTVSGSAVESVEFDSTSSLLDADGELLSDDSLVAVRAGPSADNQNADWWDNAVDYGSEPIPLVAVDGDVVGVGAPLVADGKVDDGHDTVTFYLNVWDELVEGGRVLWDHSNGTYWTLDQFGSFRSAAGSRGYDVSSTDDLARDLPDADALVMMAPQYDVWDEDLAAIEAFVSDGGTVFLHNQSDYNDYDEAQRLNEVCSALDLGFRFNDDQVVDRESNAGAFYEPVTSNFNEAFPFFGDGGGGGGGDDPNESPSASFATSSSTVAPGADVTFDAADSSDPDGSIATYEWTFGDGTAATGETATHAYDAAGTYTVTLTVTDDDGATAEATGDVTVEESSDGDRLVVDVTRVFDGDTVEVERSDGTTESVRVLGVDTPETPENADNEYAPEWEGIESKDTLGEWGNRASEYGKGELAGETVELAFDPEEGKRDYFDRLLGYVYYDADGDGSRDEFYNEAVVRDGYARVYGSSLTKHDRIQAAEKEARANDRGLWADSDPLDSPEVRNAGVEELYVPKPATVTSSSGSLSDARVPVAARPSASPAGAPLVGVDEESNVGMVGGLMPTDDYEKVDGFAVDTSNYDNYAFLANLVDYLSGTSSGDVAFEGGHGQFGAQWSMSSEDAAFFQRFLEPFGIDVDQFNDLASADLSGYRAVFLAPPASGLSTGQIDALTSFADSGGAVVLLGSSAADDAAIDRINSVASSLGSDLRLGDAAVTDGSNNLNDDAKLPTTSNFTTSFPLFGSYPTGGDGGGGGGDAPPGSASETYTGTLDGSGDAAAFSYSARTADPSELTLSLSGPSGADFDLYVTLDGRTPTTDDFDLRSWNYGSSESVTLTKADVGPGATVGILVDSYSGSGEFTLELEETGR